MVKDIDSPWVGINLDVGNFRTEPYRNIELCVPYALNVHFKPEVRQDGKPEAADWDRILRTLAPVYRGYVSLEYEKEDDPRTAVPELIGRLQHLLVKYTPGA
jgi:sugar phosphate isomerase/epimerase